MIRVEIQKASEQFAGRVYEIGKEDHDAFHKGFYWGASWVDNTSKKSEENVVLSFHICNVPCPEEVMAGANAKYEAFFVPVPKKLLPQKLLEVITKDKENRYISQVALLKNG